MPTAACSGCLETNKPHTETCRKRMMEEIRKDPTEVELLRRLRPRVADEVLIEPKGTPRERSAGSTDEQGGGKRPRSEAQGSGTQRKRSAQEEAERNEEERIRYESGRTLYEELAQQAKITGETVKPEVYLHAESNEWDFDGLRSDLDIYRERATALPNGGNNDQGEEKDELMSMFALQATNEEELPSFGESVVRDLYGENTEFIDEETGIPLPHEDVLRSRADELDDYHKMDVFEECDDEECYEMTGKPPIKSRWKDINKGDSKRMSVRSRLIAQQVKLPGWESVFTSTPPWAAFRYLLSVLMTHQGGVKEVKMLLLDIKRAFLNTRCRSAVYVKPPHLQGTQRCWRLKKAMYGTLTASSDFQHELNDCLVNGVGLSQGSGYPCCFSCPQTHIMLVYHGDDIVVVGPLDSVLVVEAKIAERFSLVRKALLGHGTKDDRQATLLNRLIHIEGDTLYLEADPRHLDLIQAGLGLRGAKGCVSPAFKLSREDFVKGVPLSPHDTTLYRAIVARARYLSEDRPDTAFIANACCRGMSNPTTTHVAILKKLGRYLIHAPRKAFAY
eukprot:6492072-Amphidinium_carterae.1